MSSGDIQFFNSDYKGIIQVGTNCRQIILHLSKQKKKFSARATHKTSIFVLSGYVDFHYKNLDGINCFHTLGPDKFGMNVIGEFKLELFGILPEPATILITVEINDNKPDDVLIKVLQYEIEQEVEEDYEEAKDMFENIYYQVLESIPHKEDSENIKLKLRLTQVLNDHYNVKEDEHWLPVPLSSGKVIKTEKELLFYYVSLALEKYQRNSDVENDNDHENALCRYISDDWYAKRKILFRPFIGKTYTYTKQKKILVLGASRYCTFKDCEYFECCARSSIHNYALLKDKRCKMVKKYGVETGEIGLMNTCAIKKYLEIMAGQSDKRIPKKYSNFNELRSYLYFDRAALKKKMIPNITTRDGFWNHIAFFNYLDKMLEEPETPKVLAHLDLYNEAYRHFYSLIMILKPDIIISWGKPVRKSLIDKGFKDLLGTQWMPINHPTCRDQETFNKQLEKIGKILAGR